MSDPTTHHAHAAHRADARPRGAMPENHLDTVAVTGSIDTAAERRASARTRVIAVISLPLFFLVAFTICYTSALHAPAPHDAPLVVAGPAQATARVASGIRSEAPSAFDLTRTTSEAAARHRVADRTAIGAVLIGQGSVTTVIASGGGRIGAQAVEAVGTRIAAGLGVAATVDDVSPLPSGDASGTALFFLILVCTIGGYLSNTVLAQVLRGPRVRTMLLTAAGAGVLTPILGFSVISVIVGDLGASFGDVAAVLGIAMIYTFTIGVVATVFTSLLGQAAIFAVILFLIAFNFPSSGGASPEATLPGFWQAIHDSWVGSGALEAARSILYFHGQQVGRWFGQLAIWTVLSLAAAVAIGLVRRRRDAAGSDTRAAERSEPLHDTAADPAGASVPA